MVLRVCGAALTMLFLVVPVQGQQARLFRSDDMSESALIDALRVKPATPTKVEPTDSGAAGEADDSGTLRSIRPRLSVPSQPRLPAQPIAAAARPSASLLITFETNSSELTAQARRNLDVVARALASDQLSEYRFSIEGHADPRGSSELNQRLSAARAESVRQYLIARHGIAEGRLAAIGKGDQEPFNPQNPIAPENRRVTIVNMSN
jgi:OmpA-OmpF porin, OOP family